MNDNTSSVSQTQLSNFATAAGVIAIVLQHAGIVIPADNISFVIFALWSLGWGAYNFYQRYKKGDLTLAGYRKPQ